MENIRCVGNRVLVKPVPKQERTKSGLILPEMAKQPRPPEGVVVALGDDIGFKVDERVFYGKYSGTKIQVEGVEHLVLREDEILGVIPKE